MESLDVAKGLKSQYSMSRREKCQSGAALLRSLRGVVRLTHVASGAESAQSNRHDASRLNSPVYGPSHHRKRFLASRTAYQVALATLMAAKDDDCVEIHVTSILGQGYAKQVRGLEANDGPFFWTGLAL
ncbi:uncharacterized protein PV09_03455 [Verruconis gallopava]|uniref:Uncharacterized protein n=1 Tax=Verruconis gallopava TaxID=253628 RepID=A0A0D2AGB8_9PEZI|nr:uncharacterized protein PV09_03455 [Verruconis gallopava]KIW05580.1 hypothetical protein PV09_03455 [Verruconis gallopava]